MPEEHVVIQGLKDKPPRWNATIPKAFTGDLLKQLGIDDVDDIPEGYRLAVRITWSHAAQGLLMQPMLKRLSDGKYLDGLARASPGPSLHPTVGPQFD